MFDFGKIVFDFKARLDYCKDPARSYLIFFPAQTEPFLCIWPKLFFEMLLDFFSAACHLDKRGEIRDSNRIGEFQMFTTSCLIFAICNLRPLK
jgi:hypothetical protein